MMTNDAILNDAIMTNDAIYDAIFRILKDNDSFALACHQNADGDGLGSVLAFHHFLSSRNKKSEIFFADENVGEFHFLPGTDALRHFASFDNDANEAKKPIVLPKVAIGFDYGDFERLAFPPLIKEKIRQGEIFFITIDHHLKNRQRGDLLCIDEKASSTCEIVADLFDRGGVSLTKEISLCLLTGIITDTFHFRHQNTTPKTLEIASRLVSQGVTINKINRSLAKKDPTETSGGLGRALSNLRINQKFNFAYLLLDQKTIEKYNIKRENLDGIGSLLANVPEVDFSLTLFEWEKEETKGSLRSQKDRDVSVLANFFGGGGHMKASGFVCAGVPEEVYQKFVEVLGETK